MAAFSCAVGGKECIGLEMEYCPTTMNTLFSLNGNRLSMRAIARVGRHCLLALRYLHDVGVAHCDVKLDNMLVSMEPGMADELMRPGGLWKWHDVGYTVKLGDFGASRIMGVGANRFQPTVEVNACGFKPPEILLAFPFGYEVDIFALGLWLSIMVDVSKSPWRWWSDREGEGPIERGDELAQYHELVGLPTDLTRYAGDQARPFIPVGPPGPGYDHYFGYLKAKSRGLFELVRAMIRPIADYRPSAQAALNDPFFARPRGSPLSPPIPEPAPDE
jgi:serine/threonine protein kinase